MNYLNRKQINQLRAIKVLFLIQVFISTLILSVCYYSEGIGEIVGIFCFVLVSVLFVTIESMMLRDINQNINKGV